MRLNPFSKPVIDANMMVSLTEEGKRAIDQEMVKDPDAYAVLSELDQHSPQSISGLSRLACMNIFSTKKQIDRLKKQGMVGINSFRDKE